MKRNVRKSIISNIMAAAMTLSSAVAVIPATTSAEEEIEGQVIVNSDFDYSEMLLPWNVVASNGASQAFQIKDGKLIITVNISDGNDSRYDLQLRHKGLELQEGHEYAVSCKISATADGYIYSSIGDYSGNNEYWHNLSGEEWIPLKVEKDKEYNIEDTFTITQAVNGPSQWTFAYANNNGWFNSFDTGMPQGSQIVFDDLKLIDKTEGAIIEYHPNEYGFINPKSNVRVNQLGYSASLAKRASYVTDNPKPCDFELRDKDGKPVYTGKSTDIVMDESAGNAANNNTPYGAKHKDSGMFVHILDFSDFDKEGTYTIFVKDKIGVSDTFKLNEYRRGENDTHADGDKLMWKNPVTSVEYCMNESAPFKIGSKIYSDQLFADSLNYFYQNRSGMDVTGKYITSGDKQGLSHSGQKSDTAFVQEKWVKSYSTYEFDGDKKYSVDVSGGWMDADSHCKSVVNGAYGVWMLQNSYELAKAMETADKFTDSCSIPENDNKYPDILDEARYELEWMMKMIVSKDDPYFGEDAKDMVYHKVQDHKYLGLGYKSWDYISDYDVTRIITPPTYAATLDLSACAAQAARLWKGIDDEFAEKCLDVAKRTYAAVKAKNGWKVDSGDYYKDPYFAPPEMAVSSKAYGDPYVQDEFYWAGCELLAATGDKEYYDDISEYMGEKLAVDSPKEDITANTYSFGSLSLSLNKDKLKKEDAPKIITSIKASADEFIKDMHSDKNGMGVPLTSIEFFEPLGIGIAENLYGYPYNSNGAVVDKALIMAYAYEFTGDKEYLSNASEAVDYIFGRNGLDFSFVTGYGVNSVEYPVHQFWANSIDPYFPKAPSGVLVSGPSNTTPHIHYLDLLGINKYTTAPQKYYADCIEAYGTNDCSIQLNAPLTAFASFMQDAADIRPKLLIDEKTDDPETTTTSATATTSTTTTTTAATTPVTADSTTVSTVPADKVGDANGDKEITMADAVIIMQAIANPDKYGVDGTDENHLTKQGLANADCFNQGDGMTSKDALAIQKYTLKFIGELPEKAK